MTVKRFSDAELVGSKVRLRPIRPEDAPFAYDQLRDDQVTRTLRWDGPSSVEELTAGYGDRARWWKDGTGCYDFALEQLTDPTIIGSIEARVQPARVFHSLHEGINDRPLGFFRSIDKHIEDVGRQLKDRHVVDVVADMTPCLA